jgi:DNA-binding SARP family transcriptional activator
LTIKAETIAPVYEKTSNNKVIFRLIGKMRVTGPGEEDLLPKARKERALLAYLCISGEARASRVKLQNLFWGESPDKQSAKSLRHAFWQIAHRINQLIPGMVNINRDEIWLDTDLFQIDTKERLAHGATLLEGFEGITLPFDQWLLAERARVEDYALRALEGTLQRLIDEDAGAELRAAAARRLANFDQTHEGAARALMAAFNDMGEPARAVREFERVRRALKDADLPMSPHTVALHESIRLVHASRRGRRSSINEVLSTEMDHTPALVDQRPSIAVLPFQGRRGHYDYFAAGMEDNLVEGLSKLSEVSVISRMSTVAFREEIRGPRDLGTALGVRYIVSGKLGILSNEINSTINLSDSYVDATIWSHSVNEHYFNWEEINERLINSIVRRIAPQVSLAAIPARRIMGPSESHELVLHAQENMHSSSRIVFDTCKALLDGAIAQQPESAAALAWRARWHLLRIAQGWSPDQKRDADEASDFAERAFRSDDTEPMALAVRAFVAAYIRRDFALTLRRFEAAFHANPNSAPAWFWSATVHGWLGDGTRALEEINKAIMLSPYDPLMHAYNTAAALAYMIDGQYHRAVESSLCAVRQSPGYTAGYVALAISMSLAEHRSEAAWAARELLKVDPTFTVQRFRERSPSCAGPNADLLCDGLTRAGLPLSG